MPADVAGALLGFEQRFEQTLTQLSKTLSRRLDLLENSMGPSRVILPSSIHVPEYLEKVVKFYYAKDKKRRCCLTGHVSDGPLEAMAMSKAKDKPKSKDNKIKAMQYVMAAHLIRTSDTKGYLKINIMHPYKETITSRSPRAAILLQKKFEFLLDLYFWALLPENPLTQNPHYLVHVFVKKDRYLEILRQTVAEIYQDHLDEWIDELQSHHLSKVQFAEDRCPSFRAVSEHAQAAVSFAKQCGWIDEDEAGALKSYADLSPVHSPTVSNADGSETA